MRMLPPVYSHSSRLLVLLAALNALAIAFYFWLLHSVGQLAHHDTLLYSTTDAGEYRDYSTWIGGTGGYCNPNRTYFYPLLLLISHSIGGMTGIWIMQFLSWLLACNLCFLAVLHMGSGRIAATVAFLLVATNISSVCITMQALTETTVLLLLALLTYLFSSHLQRFKTTAFGFKIILLLSVLFAVKPFYQLPMLAAIVLFLIYHFRALLKRPVLFLLLLLCCSPALVQYTVSKITYDTFNSDKIADINLRYYFLNKTNYLVEHPGQDLDRFNYLGDSTYSARKKQLDTYSKTAIWSYIGAHLPQAWVVFRDDLRLNITSGYPYIDAVAHDKLYQWSWRTNKFFYNLHHLAFFALLLFFLLAIRRKKTPLDFWLFTLATISFLVLLVTGITFWAGDRLIIPAIGIWSVLYVVFTTHLLKLFFTDEDAYPRKWFPGLYARFGKHSH